MPLSPRREGELPASRRAVAALALAGWALLAGCGGSEPEDGAGAEGPVVVYSSVDDVFARPIAERFQEETGIEVWLVPDTEETKSTGLLNRLIAEKERPQADVFWSGDPVRAAVLKRHGIAAPYRSPAAAGLPPRFSDPEGHWTGFSARARVLIYNREKVSEVQAPASIFDLLEPRFRGQACLANPLFGPTSMHAAALFAALGDERARQFFEDFAANGGRMVSSNGEVRRRVANGECMVGITDTDDANVARLEGKPVGIVFPDADGLGTLIVPDAAVLIAGAPHPDAGRRFIDFLLAPETEKALAESEAAQMPVRPGLPPPAGLPALEGLKDGGGLWGARGPPRGAVARLPQGVGGPEQRMSPLALERPSRWRAFGVAGVFAFALLPSLPLLAEAAGGQGGLGSFPATLWASAGLATVAAALGLVVGLPLGVAAALYSFPGRRALLALASLPLLVPSLLWAVGWSALLARLAPGLLPGAAACVVVFATTAIPLVLLTAWASTSALGAGQVEAARLAGGERALVRSACRHASVPALLAAGLAGVLVLSDPAPGQIFGTRTAAAEILVSFAALFDFGLAARQGLALAGLVLVLATPLAAVAAPRLAAAVLPRAIRPLRPVWHSGMAALAAGGLLVFVGIGVAAPLAGLALPALRGTALARAGSEVVETLGNTTIYGLGAGALAAVLGVLLAAFAGRSSRLRAAVLALSFLLLALPSALPSLGLLRWSGEVPAAVAPMFHSRLTVCVALGLRFLPVAALLALRGWASTSPTWALAAGLHGVSLGRYLARVLAPRLAPATATGLVLVALLAAADVGTVLLLHPPGRRSLPLAIFTVMANAPEALVASLCLLYVVGAGTLLAVLPWLAGRRL